MDLTYSTINIYDALKIKYKDYLRSEIVSIAIIQSNDTVWLESVEIETVEGGFEKQTVRKINLDFIVDIDLDVNFFDPSEPIENNAKKFVEDFSPYSIINTTDLFHQEAGNRIDKKYRLFGIDK